MLDRMVREFLPVFAYLPPFNRILMSVTCNKLKHQTLTKILEKYIVKSLTNIS